MAPDQSRIWYKVMVGGGHDSSWCWCNEGLAFGSAPSLKIDIGNGGSGIPTSEIPVTTLQKQYQGVFLRHSYRNGRRDEGSPASPDVHRQAGMKPPLSTHLGDTFGLPPSRDDDESQSPPRGPRLGGWAGPA